MTDVIQKVIPKSKQRRDDVASKENVEPKVEPSKQTLNKLQDVFDKRNKGEFVLSEAVQKKHQTELEELKKELASGEFKIDSQLRDGRTPLFVVVCNGNFAAVKFLVEAGANLEIHENENGNTALMAAISLGYNEIVDYLIQKGADIHAVNKHGNTIVHFAAICGSVAILKYAYEHGCDINQKDNEGNCAILFATGNNYKKVVEYLLEKNVDIDVIDSEKVSLLHVCIQHDRNEILNSILLKNRSTLNKYYSDYQTALFWAALTDKYKSVYVLLMYGAKPNLNNSLNQSPLYWSVFNQNLEMTKMLIDYGADIHCRYRVNSLASIHCADVNLGDSILRTAMRGYTYEIIDLLKEHGGEDHREY